jgi:TetR/AcrR family transcriptional regulator, transcriptional repressor for nem operon
MSKAQQTQHYILEQSAILFNQQGYAGSSMADVMRVTGLQKGGIYNHFSSKDELALAAFDFAVQQMQTRFLGVLKGKRHALDRLMAILSVYETLLENPPMRGGCPLLNTAVESDDTHPALRERTQRAMTNWLNLLRGIVQRGIDRGELNPTIDPEMVVTVMIATIEGGVMLTKLYGDSVYMQRSIAHLKAYLQQQVQT